MMGVQPLQLPKIHPQTLHIQPITTPKLRAHSLCPHSAMAQPILHTYNPNLNLIY